MSKKQKRKPVVSEVPNEIQEQEYSDKTIKIYKVILKTMGWIVGVSFILVIILPLFEDTSLDTITKYIFRIGILTLLTFTVIEFIGDSVKQKIEKLIKTTADESKSTIS